MCSQNKGILCEKQITHFTKKASPVVVPVKLSQNAVRLLRNANSDILETQKIYKLANKRKQLCLPC